MLNTTRFEKSLLIKVMGAVKTVHEWDADNGQGEYVHTVILDHLDDVFTIEKEDLHFLDSTILRTINFKNYSKLKMSDLYITSDMIGWNQLEDADCNILESIEDERKAEKAYICDYYISISINGLELDGDELQAIFEEVERVC